MNPAALFRNVVHSTRICPTWSDRLNYLGWLYSNRLHHRNGRHRQREIAFRCAAPVFNMDLTVRDNRGSDAFIFSEIFTHHYYDFPLPFRPTAIVDLGANAGFTSIFFARKYPDARVIAVEPVASNLELLQKNIELNHLNLNIEIVHAAIAVRDGTVLMDVSGLDYAHRVIDHAGESVPTSQVTRVGAISIPTLMRQFRMDRISLLKIDIEGYETRLLTEDCEWLRFVDAICIEIHDGYADSDLSSLAVDYGFKPPQRLPGIWLLTRDLSRN